VNVLHFPLRYKIFLSFIVLSLKKIIYEWNKYVDFETSEVRTITLGRDCVNCCLTLDRACLFPGTWPQLRNIPVCLFISFFFVFYVGVMKLIIFNCLSFLYRKSIASRIINGNKNVNKNVYVQLIQGRFSQTMEFKSVKSYAFVTCSGHPSMYWPRSLQLNFRDQERHSTASPEK
jgi:hypothetical protein